MISVSCRYPLAFRQEFFHKVERQYMLGLRAKDPEMRKRFFKLYHDSVGKSLFSRLQFIIQSQDWEAVSDVFWLKQGLDLILAILVENEPITLAANSARVPALMVAGPVPDRVTMPQQIPDAQESMDGTSLSFDSLAARHAQFLNEASKLVVITYTVNYGGTQYSIFSKKITRPECLFSNLVGGRYHGSVEGTCIC
jgi:transformation/transcription domain-associated protein